MNCAGAVRKRNTDTYALIVTAHTLTIIRTIAATARERVMNKCDYCGWVDTDPSFFWYYAGKNYCSLHKEGKSDE